MAKTNALLAVVTTALDDLKAQNIVTLEVTHLTTMTDHMVIATGTSQRHVNALAQEVAEKAKASGTRPLSIQGSNHWVIVDFGDVIAHVMTQETREFYQLEKLWSMPAADEQNEQQASAAS